MKRGRLRGGSVPDEKSFHMTPDDFRRHGHAVVDWIADYYARIESFPVLSLVEPGQVRASLPADPPAKGEPFQAILHDVQKLILPGITHWQSPNFFAFFPANASGPAILGDLLSSGLGVQGMLWATSPACTELETHVLDWLGSMLVRQIEQDRRAGLVSCFVCATVGTTSSNAIDPVPEIGRICREHNLWLHVDAAMSGTAALCPEFRHIHDGLELADSYTFNPHKWMFTNFDCNCFYVADRKALIQTLSVLPEYLRNKATESGAVIDYRDWQIPLGRRFRSLKLWFVIRHYGVEGLQYHIRRHVELAQRFAQWVRKDNRFELAVPAPLNLVCFRHKGGDKINQTLMDHLNRSGDLYLTHTRLNDRLTLRFCVGQTNTASRHVEHAWKRIQEEAANLEASK